jgi:hypothetical protein
MFNKEANDDIIIEKIVKMLKHLEPLKIDVYTITEQCSVFNGLKLLNSTMYDKNKCQNNLVKDYNQI